MTTENSHIQAYQSIRGITEALCQPLAIEDYVIQSIDDTSPPKWHLAHTTWFFETFLLTQMLKEYTPFHPQFQYLFNSYYQGIGDFYPRVKRGLLSRPTVEEISAYRRHVDDHMLELLHTLRDEDTTTMNSLLTLGLNHEQQHQELLLMDIKHNFSIHPDHPVFNAIKSTQLVTPPGKLQMIPVAGGVIEIGYQGNDFCFDNELPRHKQILRPYQIATRLVTNAEYCEFIADNGYQTPQWWLADGWDYAQKHHWQAPLYWQKMNGKWFVFTLNGLQELNPHEPVAHVSYYEADAYARWKQVRLPTEAEWEHFTTSQKIKADSGHFMESGIFHPQTASTNEETPRQFFGDLWEWTCSSYSPYPGYKPLNGALGEYNGKFMSSQMVLRGGCCATPASHVRASYRNFYQPEKRWQFSGIRLASDI